MINKGFVFVVTGMSYIIDSSGTSKVVKAHEEIFNNKGISCVVIFPISKSFGKGKNTKIIKTGYYGLVKDGVFDGIVTVYDILNYLTDLNNNCKCIGVLIHHLIRNKIDDIKYILKHIHFAPIVYYLHDFYSCCVNPAMLKNDSFSCLDNNNSCNDCVYLQKKLKHYDDISNFFSFFSNRLSFVAPSEFVKKKWIHYYPQYANCVYTIPHLKCIGQYTDNNGIICNSDSIKIAFLGSQTHIKGWDIFKKAVFELIPLNCNYKFYYLGNGNEIVNYINNIFVDINTMGKDAMIETLRKNNIDVVFLASICGETYSYTMYESRAANCFILTLRDSGNIAYEVKSNDWGIVFDNDNSLIDRLSNEYRFRNTLNDWRKKTIIGPANYMDNDKILELFSDGETTEILWKNKKPSLIKKIIKLFLYKIFFNRRLVDN